MKTKQASRRFAEHTPALRATPLKRGINQARPEPTSPLKRGAHRAGCVEEGVA